MEAQAKNGFGRREFIGAAASALLAGVVLQITGCGTEDKATAPVPVPSDGSLTGTIEQNHSTPHRAVVTKDQIDAGAALPLDIQGAADHTHILDLTAEDMAMLKNKEMVMHFTGKGGSDDHVHMVMFN